MSSYFRAARHPSFLCLEPELDKPAGGFLSFYVKALQLRINGVGRPMKGGRYFGGNLSGLREVVQLLSFVGGPRPSRWR
jgi:hypothetical protein